MRGRISGEEPFTSVHWSAVAAKIRAVGGDNEMRVVLLKRIVAFFQQNEIRCSLMLR